MSASRRDNLRSVDRLLSAHLQAIGFARLVRGIYERGASTEVKGWLGLNESFADGVQLFPFVGVRHHEVEAMLERLGAGAFSGPLATVELGYLMPDGVARWWTFQGEIALDEAVAGDLVANVEQFALPFFEWNRELAALAESVETNADEDSRAYVLPVVYRLMQQPRLAEQALDEELRADASQAGLSYRRLIARFLET